MSTLLAQVAAFWTAARAAGVVAPGPVVVGVSGGPDSLALLHALRALSGDYGIALHVAHLDHGWRGAAGQADATFVAALAAEWGLPATVRAFDVPAYAHRQHLSPEEAARDVRYAFFAAVAQQVGAAAVAVGHNADDQVETVVGHWLRGAGPRGLGGMAPWGPLPPCDFGFWIADFGLASAPADPKSKIQNPKHLLRPLLGIWRAQIEDYCAEWGLAPREDASNADLTYRRNYLRHVLIPQLEQAQPGFARRTWEVAAVFHDEDAFLEAELDRVWSQVATYGIDCAILYLAPFATLAPALQRRVLRRAAQGPASGGIVGEITSVHIRAALALLGPQGRTGAQIYWPGGVVIRRERDRAVLSPDKAAARGTQWPLLADPGEAIPLPSSGELHVSGFLLTVAQGPPPTDLSVLADLGPWAAWFDADALLGQNHPALVLRARRPGDRIRPFGADGHSRKLQDVLVDAGIPVYLRDRWVLLAQDGGEILWVPGPGGRRSIHAPVTPATRRVLMLIFRADQIDEEASSYES